MHSPQCDIAPAFQLACIVSPERHNLRTGCTYRTVHVDGSKDLLHMQTAMHGVAKDASCTDMVHPHCNAALYTPARSKPSCYITSARRCILKKNLRDGLDLIDRTGYTTSGGCTSSSERCKLRCRSDCVRCKLCCRIVKCYAACCRGAYCVDDGSTARGSKHTIHRSSVYEEAKRG